MVDDGNTHDSKGNENWVWAPNWSEVGRRNFLLSAGVLGVGSAAGCIGTDDEQSTEESTSADNPVESDESEDGGGAEEGAGGGDETESDEGTEEDEDEEVTERADMRVYAMDKESGEYLTGAEVTVESRETGETYSLTTKEGQEFDGNYARFQDLPLGLYYVTITAEGYEEATNTIHLVESGRQPILHMISTSTQTADMRVYAEHTETGEYLSSVDITIKNQETGNTQTMMTTEGQEFDGTYARFQNLPLGAYEVTARLPGFEPAQRTIELDESGRQPILEMSPDEPGTDDAYTITVRLVDAATGEPISDGTILMWLNRLGYGPGPDATNDNGEVTFEHLDHYGFEQDPDLEMSGLQAHAAGYNSVRRSISWRPSAGPTELTVEMEPENTSVERSILTVNAVAADTGDPVKIANVYIEHRGNSVITERTDRLGTAQFSLEDGLEYTIEALGEGGIYESETRTVVLNGDTRIILSMERS